MTQALVAYATLAIAAVTLTLMIITERRQQQHARYVYLNLNQLGTANDGTDGRALWHIWTLTNEGTADARVVHLLSVGCNLRYDAESLPFEIVHAGETKQMKVAPRDISTAWVLLIWSAPHGRGHTVEWFAPNSRDYLKRLSAQPPNRADRWSANPPWWLPYWWRPVRPVGPGGAMRTRISTAKRLRRDLVTALSIADPTTTGEFDAMLDSLGISLQGNRAVVSGKESVRHRGRIGGQPPG